MSAPSLPKSCSCLTPLFSGALVSINNWRCSGDDSPGREDEWCDADRIVVTRRGSYELTIGGVAHFVDPLVATFWNRGDYYRVRHPVSGSDECTIFRLSERASQELAEFTARRPRAVRNTFAAAARTIDGRTYLKHRAALAEARVTGPSSANALAVEEAALEFVRKAVGDDAHEQSKPRSRERARIVARAREILSSDFSQPLSLDRIARDAECSPFHLSRLFRQATGVTLYRAVVRLRLREGLERLLDAPEQISSVALDTGFASHSHFTDAFRLEYHCSPRDARARLKQ